MYTSTSQFAVSVRDPHVPRLSSSQGNTPPYSNGQLLYVATSNSATNGPVVVRGNVFVNNTLPLEAASVFYFDIKGPSTGLHTIAHNVWVDNVLRGPAAEISRPSDRTVVAPVIQIVVSDARQINITFVSNVLHNPLARREFMVNVRHSLGLLFSGAGGRLVRRLANRVPNRA